MNCFRCKKLVIRPLRCKTCKLAYHPSCAKETAKSKIIIFCVSSFISLSSPHTRPSNTQDRSSQHSAEKSSALFTLRRRSSLTSFKSINSSPKTPHVTSIGEYSVFLSPSQINSPTRANANNLNSSVNSLKMSNTGTRDLTETIMSAAGIETQIGLPSNTQALTVLPNSSTCTQITSSLPLSSQATINKPDWSKYNLEDKMNMLLDLSFNNSFNIQNVSDSLKKHSEQIEN